MEITYLIGNGLDIALGLKTRYSEFYDYYLQTNSDEDCIHKFKLDIGANKDTWAEAELALGDYTKNFSNADISLFRKCRNDFFIQLAKYLSEQDMSLDVATYSSIISPSFRKAILSFPDFLLPESSKIVKQLFVKSHQENHQYNFINFNYTSVFDRCIKTIVGDNSAIQNRKAGGNVYIDKLGEIIHIHGTTSSNMIMGVNDESQISNKDFLNVQNITNTLIKPSANNSNHLGNANLCLQYIDRSSIIIVFGMSLGQTDNFWWRKIGKWLKYDSKHLILFMYNPYYSEILQSSYIELEEEIVNLFFYNAEVDVGDEEQMRSRIHVCINKKLFGDDPHLSTLVT